MRFLPKLRVVEDLKTVDELSKADEAGSVSTEEEYFEVRDESKRPWWKFFDDYEYRLNDKARAQHTWWKWFKDSDTPAERKLIMKLDLILTFYSFVAYWAKYLDQTNLNNAYVGGLKEGIGMKGNDLVNTQVLFSVGNIVFQIPFMYILYSLPLNFVLPSLDLAWSILTIGVGKINTVPQLKALRFLIGVFEAPSYLAYQWLFASWYTSDEMARRSMFYYFGQYLGILTSGVMSGAIERNLQGVSGMAAWRWIFIIDGCATIGVGLIGFFLLPGTPQRCYSLILTDDEIRLARRRMERNKTEGNGVENRSDYLKQFFDLKLWKKIFSSWHIYVLSLWNIFCWLNNNGSSGAYLLWLKSLKNSEGTKRYGAGELQDRSSLTPGLGLVWLLLTCFIADLFHARWQAIIFSQIFNIIGNVILAVWYVPERAKWFAFCLQYFGWAMAPVLYTWQGDICRRNVKERTVVLVTMNMLAQACVAWTSVLVWKTVEAPRYLKGYSFTASAALALSMWTFVVLYFYKKDERKYARDNGIILVNGEEEKVQAEQSLASK